ncbi:hypothetical protein EJB05_36769, partial [Eragrostis curvula]
MAAEGRRPEVLNFEDHTHLYDSFGLWFGYCGLESVPRWGEKGYMRMHRDIDSEGTGLCGIYKDAIWPAFQLKKLAEKLKQTGPKYTQY